VPSPLEALTAAVAEASGGAANVSYSAGSNIKSGTAEQVRA
jgi:hypothetical protein